MIEHLKGIHETVQYQKDRQVLLHQNQEAENYPPHWHLPFELIMPTQNGYHVTCGREEFFLEETDILLICPGVIHELYAPEKGSLGFMSSFIRSFYASGKNVPVPCPTAEPSPMPVFFRFLAFLDETTENCFSEISQKLKITQRNTWRNSFGLPIISVNISKKR